MTTTTRDRRAAANQAHVRDLLASRDPQYAKALEAAWQVPAAWLDTTAETACALCPALLHRAPVPGADEWGWADRDGRACGDDPDVAHLLPDPYAYLAALGERAMALMTGPKRQRDLAAATVVMGEYSALKVRLDLGGTFHQHHPGAGRAPFYAGPAVPECCGWPALLRPSGFTCRQCGTRLAVL